MRWVQDRERTHVWRARTTERVHVYKVPRGWIPYTPAIAGGLYPTRELAQAEAERWLAVQRGHVPRVMRVARDEWPDVSWNEWDAWDGPTARAEGWIGAGVGVLVERTSGGWCAAVTWRGHDGRIYWHPRATHPTARAALRDLRYSLRWSLAAVLRDLMLNPERVSWQYVEAVARVARERVD